MSTLKRKVLVIIGIIPVVLGILKIYLHIFSVWRFGYLDYMLGAGLIFGGLLLFSKRASKPVLFASGIFIIFELYKGIYDHKDLYDVFLTILAITYLIIPFLKFYWKKNES